MVKARDSSVRGDAPYELYSLSLHSSLQPCWQTPFCKVYARYVPYFCARIWWVKSHSDFAVAEFKYCKSHIRSRLVESFFSISRLMYRHPILAGSEQKTHFLCYGDSPREDFNSWDTNGRTSVPLYRDTSVDISSHTCTCVFENVLLQGFYHLCFHPYIMSKQLVQTEQEGYLVIDTYSHKLQGDQELATDFAVSQTGLDIK